MRSIPTKNLQCKKKFSPQRRHPFSLAFSPRRMSQCDFAKRVPPAPVARTRTVAELIASARRKLHHGQRWGDWQLDVHRLTLDFAPERVWRYELDLEHNHDSASILDFIFQFHGKIWATPQVLSDLLDALHAIFDPQRFLCSCGSNKELPKNFLASRIEPPTNIEREESARRVFETNAAWIGNELTKKLLSGTGCCDSDIEVKRL